MYEHRTIHKRFICGVLLIGDYVYAKDGFDYAFYRKSTNNVDDIITTFFGDDALLYDGNNMDMILREGDLLNSVISMPRQMGKTTLLREMLDDNDIQSNR